MSLGPFNIDRPLVGDRDPPLSINLPLVQPERASYLEHHVTRESAAEVAYNFQLKQQWVRNRLAELNNELEQARSKRNRLELRYDNTPSAIQQDRLADKIHQVDEEIEEINQKIEDIQSGEVTPGKAQIDTDPKSLSLYQIEEALPEVLYEEIRDLGITEEPSVQAKASEVIILTKVSNVTMDTAHRVGERYESLGLMVKDVKFR